MLPEFVYTYNKKTLRQIRLGHAILDRETGDALVRIGEILRQVSFEKCRGAIEKRQYFLALCLVAEMRDRRGEYRLAAPWLRDCDEILKEVLSMTQLGAPDSAETDLYIQKVWLLLQRSVNDHRLGAPELALQRTEALYKHMSLLAPPARFSDLRFRICYTLARHYQEVDLERTEKLYLEGLEFCRSRLDAVFENSDDTLRKGEESRYVHYNTGILVLGLARCMLLGDDIQRARSFILLAQVLLRNSDEETTRAFATLLLGIVHRREGNLEEAEGLLESSLAVFDRAHHQRFFLRCRFELATVLFEKRQHSKAEATLNRQLKGSIENRYSDDARKETFWELSSQLLASRIARAQKNTGQAARLAEIAIRKIGTSEFGNLGDLQTQSALVLAEALIDLGKFDDAEKLCAQCERRTHKKRNEEGWLILVQWENCLMQDKIDLATQYRDGWNMMSKELTNWGLNQRARILDSEHRVKISRGFYISGNSVDLDISKHEEALKVFLTRRAAMLHKKLDERARALGVGRQTLANWLTIMKKKDRE
ncbi:MAG: hypothetical protein WBY44_30360 [Bryobacteraceae bacterium]